MKKNNGGFRATRFLLFCTMAAVAAGCVKNPNEGPGGGTPSVDDYPTFATSQVYATDINYHLNGYRIDFEIFNEDPYTVDAEGVLVKKDIEPYFRGTTDVNGRFTGNITMPSTVKEAWVSSEDIGSIGTVHLKLTGNRIDFDQDSFIAANAKSKALTATGYAYPDNCKVLGNWTDVYGTPAYLLPGKAKLAASFITKVNKVYSPVRGKYISEQYPELLENSASADIAIKSPTKVNMVFLKSGASWKNVVGYFTYQTGTTPTVDNIDKIIAFPNVTQYFRPNSTVRVGTLTEGDQVQLKYWNGTAFQDEFPAGVSLGFFLMGDWFVNGNIAETNVSTSMRDIRYSNPDLNPAVNGKKMQRAVSLYDQQSGLVAVGFEDNSDLNYTDALFALDIEHQNATPDVPIIPNPGADPDRYTEYTGTLAFEDVWPYEGDYDMNDVVIYYKSKVYTDQDNNVTRTVDEITAKNNGAYFTDGFGFQFHKLGADAIRSIEVKSDLAPSAFMKGQSLEPGQDHPTVILFDAIATAVKHTFTVTTVYTSGVSYEKVVPPYNPFAVLKTDEGRGRELHLVNYPPTSLANLKDLHTGDDVSQPAKGLYYVRRNNQFPFAIHIAGYDFQCPKEGSRINVAYPKFSSWVASGQPADWYKQPDKSLVNE